MYNSAVATVQFRATALFSFQRRRCSIHNGQGVQSCRRIQEADIYADLERRDVLYRALKQITDRERYVLFAHVLEEKDFGQIGKELGLSYKGAASVYYRAIARMRRQIGGDPDGF